MEIALHCDARTISTAVRHFACPECFLGIVPAWGGTQLVRRHGDRACHVRRRHGPQHRSGQRAEPRRAGDGALPPEVNAFGLTYRKTQGLPAAALRAVFAAGHATTTFLANYAHHQHHRRDLARARRRGGACLRRAEYAMRIWLSPDQLPSSGSPSPTSQRAVQSRAPSTPPARSAASRRRTARSSRTRSARRGGSRPPRSSATSSCAPTPTARSVRVEGRRARRARRAELPADRPLQRAARGGHRRLPAPGLERARRGRRRREGAWRSSERASRRTSTTRSSLDTTLRRSPRASGRSSITLLEAIVLVILVVFVFLQSWRATLIPLLTVPVSLIGAFALFPLLGFSINTLSLFGLVLAIGLVVDDAIVVVEAVEHHIEEGMTPREATLKAMARGVRRRSIAHRARAVGGVRPGRVHRRHHGAAVPAVRADDRDLGDHLGVQRADARARRCARCCSGRASGRAGLLGRFFGGFNRGFERVDATATSARQRLLVRKAVIALGLLRRGFAALARLLGKKMPSGFVPDEDQGYCLRERAAARRPRRCSAPTRSAARSRRSCATTTGVAGLQRRSPASACSRASPRRTRGFFFVSARSRGTSADGEADAQGASSQRAERSACADPGRATSSRSAARHPGPRHRGRLRRHAPGPQRRHGRRCSTQSCRSSWPPREAAGDRPLNTHVPRDGAADLRRRRPGQGAQAGRATSATCTRRCRRSWAARTSTTSIASAGSGASTCRPRREYRIDARRHRRFYVRNDERRRWCRSRRSSR